MDVCRYRLAGPFGVQAAAPNLGWNPAQACGFVRFIGLLGNVDGGRSPSRCKSGAGRRIINATGPPLYPACRSCRSRDFTSRMSLHPRFQAKVANRPLAFTVALGCLLTPGRAQDLESSQQMVIHGEYEKVIETAKAALKSKPDDAAWSLLLGQALMETGRYSEARDTFSAGVSQTPLDLSLRLAAYEAARAIGKAEVAQMELSQMDQLGGSLSRSLTRPAERIALGRVALLAGGDPKRVLDVFFDPARKEGANPRG